MGGLYPSARARCVVSEEGCWLQTAAYAPRRRAPPRTQGGEEGLRVDGGHAARAAVPNLKRGHRLRGVAGFALCVCECGGPGHNAHEAAAAWGGVNGLG